MFTWPEFGLVRSWFKAYMFLHVLLLNGAAFLISFAIKGKDVPQARKDTLANILFFVMVLSTTASSANALHEVQEKLKSLNWFKALVLTVLLVVNYNIITTSLSKEGDNVSKDDKGQYADNGVILFGVSCILTAVTSFIKLEEKEELDDIDLESGNPTTLLEYKQAVVDQETSLKTLVIMLENIWRTNHQLVRDNTILMSWLNRVESN